MSMAYGCPGDPRHVFASVQECAGSVALEGALYGGA